MKYDGLQAKRRPSNRGVVVRRRLLQNSGCRRLEGDMKVGLTLLLGFCVCVQGTAVAATGEKTSPAVVHPPQYHCYGGRVAEATSAFARATKPLPPSVAELLRRTGRRSLLAETAVEWVCENHPDRVLKLFASLNLDYDGLEGVETVHVELVGLVDHPHHSCYVAYFAE